jgi:hypothetical protein
LIRTRAELGCIGTRGQEKVEEYPTEQEAREALEAIAGRNSGADTENLGRFREHTSSEGARLRLLL